MDAIAQIKKAVGKDKIDAFVFGHLSGEDVGILFEGDPDDVLSILVHGFHQALEFLREDGVPDSEIREAGLAVLEDMRKGLEAPGPRLVE